MPNLFPFTGRVFGDRSRSLFSREDERGREEFLKEVKQTIRQLYNHPSIVLWTAFFVPLYLLSKRKPKLADRIMSIFMIAFPVAIFTVLVWLFWKMYSL